MSYYGPSYGPHIPPCIPGVDWQSRCGKCEGDCRIVPSDGPLHARLFLIGERPGQDEMHKSMRPFTGKSGRELNENYLNLAGTTRDDVYVVNSVHCGQAKNQTPGKLLTESCSRHFMPYELDEVQPTFLIPMGATACSLFDNIHLKTHHGMPIKRELFGKKYWVVPQWHPAAGLHDTKLMTNMLEDWSRLKDIIGGDFTIPIDRYKNPDYRLVHGRAEVEAYMKPAVKPAWILYGGLDTETDAGKLWCITVSVRPGTGIMILATDLDGLQAFRENCDLYHFFIHNAIFDLDKLAERDIHLKRVSCTMQAAYHRGNLPQGLKQLAWRLLGITMTEYEDVVVPQSKVKLLDWWRDALLLLDQDKITTERISEKTGKPLKPVIKPTKIFSRMMFIYNKGEQPSETYDMWKMWDKITETAGVTVDDKRRVVDALGKPPRQSIIHVPLQDSPGVTGAITYAVRDACACLRLGLHLRSQEREIRRAMTTIVR